MGSLLSRPRVLCVLVIALGLFVMTSCTDEQDEAVLATIKTLASTEGETVAALASQDALEAYGGQEGIAAQIDSVYDRLQVTDLDYERIRRTLKEEDRITFTAQQVLTSDLIGQITQPVELSFVQDPASQTWKLDWKPGLILEGLTQPDDLVIETLPAKRGTLTDRQGRILAQDQEDGFRSYPFGPAIGPILGYVRDFNPDYDSGDILSGTPVGRMGLEKAYDDRLRPEFGVKIYVQGQGDLLFEREPQNGEDISLTLDAAVQNAAYDTILGEFGAVAAIHPRSGQVIAMVSGPSYHPEDWSNEVMDDLTYYNHVAADTDPGPGVFAQVYTPGSTQKLPTILAGFMAGTLTQETGYEIYGSRWQPDHTWGGYTVHRVIPYNGWVDLYRAIVYSDNIFFARQGLDMGYQAFEAGMKALGYDQEVPGALDVEPSQTSEDHDLDRDVALADSAYGQYQVKVSPLHLALIYTCLTNDGTMMTPSYAMDETPTPWKEDLVNPENIYFLNQAFTEVINTNHTIGYRPYAKISGKTGTAETGPDGKTYMGWFVGQDLNNPTLTMAVMISPTNNRGESDLPTSYFAQILDRLYAAGNYVPAYLPAIPVEAETPPEDNQGAPTQAEMPADQSSAA